MTFKPTPRAIRATHRNVRLVVDPTEYDRLAKSAKAAGVSLREFVRQAVLYAMEHLDA